MKLLDSLAHLTYRSSSDHQAMARAGVCAVLEPCTWPGQPRSSPETVRDHLSGLVGFERSRAGQFGIRHFSALALNPREANDPALAPPVIEQLAFFLAKDCVLAVGETGYDAITEAEQACFEWQLDLAKRFKLPVLVRVPAAERMRGVRQALSTLRASRLPLELALIGPNDEETLPAVLSAGCWASFSSCLRARFDVARMVEIVRRFGTERLVFGSGADWDLSEALAVPAFAASLRQEGVGATVIERLLWTNPLSFLKASGRLPPDLAAEVPVAAAAVQTAKAPVGRRA